VDKAVFEEECNIEVANLVSSASIIIGDRLRLPATVCIAVKTIFPTQRAAAHE